MYAFKDLLPLCIRINLIEKIPQREEREKKEALTQN